MSPVELRRIIAEWRLRMQRVKDILQPVAWNEKEWRQFSQALALLVRDHGQSWIIDPNVYWDLRWKLQDGGELVCQVEHVPEQKTSLVVAQTGGFASQAGSYTWLWAEFDMEGNFSRDPYWVDGSWRDALTALLLPLDRQSSYLLAGRTDTPNNLLLQEGARPNDGNVTLALPDAYAEEEAPEPEAPRPAEPVTEPVAEAPVPSAPESAPPEPEPKLETPPAETVPIVPAPEETDSAPNGNGHPEIPASLFARDKLPSAEEQARFRRLRAKAHFAESLRRVPPLGRQRPPH